MCCDAALLERDLDPTGIAHKHIKDRRVQRIVPVSKGGMLSEYVPFYLAPRSPMLFAIHRGYVEGYKGGQRFILHLVASVEEIAASGLDYAFTDGHAEMAISRYFVNLDDLIQIDWTIMRAKYWSDNLDDGDRKRRRQAEFLIHSFLPWESVYKIGVLSQNMANDVSQVISKADHKPVIEVHEEWYY